MEIIKIELLTEPQYLAYKHLINNADGWWWLSSPAPDSRWRVRVVDQEGEIDNTSCQTNNVFIRPFCVFGLNFDDPIYWKRPDSLIGAKFKFGKYEWVILDIVSNNLLALCDELTTEYWFDANTNIWRDSELKRWLDIEGLRLINN